MYESMFVLKLHLAKIASVVKKVLALQVDM